MTSSSSSHDEESGSPPEEKAKAQRESDSPEEEAKAKAQRESDSPEEEAKAKARGESDSPEEGAAAEEESDSSEEEAKAKAQRESDSPEEEAGAQEESDSPEEEAKAKAQEESDSPEDSRKAEGPSKAEARDAPPVIGQPTQPPPALTVAISERFVATVRSARRRQWAVNTLGISGVVAGAVALAIAVEGLTGRGRVTALVEAFVGGGLLVAGSVLKRRPLQLGVGVCARGAEGRIALRTSLLGVFLLISSLFREAAEGAVYGLGIVQSDPATELAAWLVLALSKPHGPGPGVWVSLEGVNAAGLFGFPEDLKVALSALRVRGRVEADAGRYPPLVRLPEGAGDFLAELMR